MRTRFRNAAVPLIAVIDRVDVVGELQRPRMRHPDVRRLVEGVDRGLPVARHFEGDVVGDRPLVEVIRIAYSGPHSARPE
jgi:hypothetical protein